MFLNLIWDLDRVCELQAEATSDANSWLTALYHEGLFIRAPVARGIALRGLKFLHGYAKLAKMAFDRGQKRFALIPKGHYLHHQVLDLLHQSERSRWCPNLLMYGCQLQEDYVGRPSRISRRVSPKTVPLRVLQRSFLAIRAALGDDENMSHPLPTSKGSASSR